MILLEKLKILTPLQNLPKNVGDLAQLIVAKGFKKLPKVHKIAKSGHTEHQRSAVRIQSLAILFTINCIEKPKIKKKEAKNGPILDEKPS